jgi:hypothetical protein
MNSSATESRFEGEPMRTRTKSQFLVVLWMAVLPAAGCVSSELEAPANHPGHPAAHPAKLTLSRALHPDHGVQEEAADDEGPPHAGHETDTAVSKPSPERSGAGSSPTTQEGTAAIYVCPMHPEIVRKEAGKCPICGMNLVLRKGAK